MKKPYKVFTHKTQEELAAKQKVHDFKAEFDTIQEAEKFMVENNESSSVAKVVYQNIAGMMVAEDLQNIGKIIADFVGQQKVHISPAGGSCECIICRNRPSEKKVGATSDSTH